MSQIFTGAPAVPVASGLPDDGPELAELVARTDEFNTGLRERIYQFPLVPSLTPAQVRAERAAGRTGWPQSGRLDVAEDVLVPGRRGPIKVRVLVPPRVEGVYLHIPGGGFVLGSADRKDKAHWELAVAANVAVVSVDYAKAPESAYPAAPDDCEDVARWLIAESADRFGTDRLVIGGESAGGNLSAVTLLRLREQGLAGRFRGANLVYGVFDCAMTPSQRLWGELDLLLSTPMLEWFYGHYLPGGVDRRSPDVSPIWADLTGMPPARISVGTLDPLLDDSLFMAARWAAAGNPVALHVYPHGTHGFTAFADRLEMARVANAAGAEFVCWALEDENAAAGE
ncbi:alpha/beta hydrolase [Actinomadura chibensis]|uniref:Alpha/beta hydrolase n=1 Tax=Actinomadura chibensis TaxID=392828 RepID=A0A5D0NUP1_9ACTN|nr:alpha/beta hydrolase [Actinomadura chibensis]TYB48226.1 alpha/beta hydrolase [Actinomadura chibensis]